MSKYEEPNVYMSKREPTSKTQNFFKFLFNKETGQILGRTPKSWAQISVFYVIFYLCLSVLFALCMWVFLQTLDPKSPKWKLEQSLIGKNPGLGFRPMPPESNVESTLIWFKGTKPEDYKYWTDELKKFLSAYKTPGARSGENSLDCSYEQYPKNDEVCIVNPRSFSPCIEENNFSYDRNSPCIFLKLNKIYGWIPEPYNNTKELPEDMPEKLKNHIQSIARTKPLELNTVWVTCEGETPHDKEILGEIDYHPRQGFPKYYFPYRNNEGYMSPLIAVHLKNPQRGILINIECKAWAKNIIHNRQDRIGSVHLELMVD